ncbi:hypothetical protein G9C98_006129, partial [Cotesia typhae]
MEMGLGSTLLPGDPRLIDHIVGEADLNKNQLRETLRKHISDAAYLDAGVERIVDQVVNPKIYSVFLPQVEDVVYKYLGLEKPKREKNGGNSIKDLLPIDLDPVSPESDKNSLKDVSLDSIDDLELSNKDNTDQVDNAESSHVTDYEKSIEEKEEKDSKELVENEVNGTDLTQSLEEEKPTCSTPPLVDIGLNDSIKSDEKTEEEEEDSPVFEPIDVINFHESNVSNDSHLSGISELTSHRSRSPDFQINEFSRDHFDFSNQDSQFSKVSSDSRLSIVTDFGSSNQASTPVPDVSKEEKSTDKNYDDKNKDKAIESKESKNSKSSSGSSSKERETAREKNDHKSKSSKERSDSRDSRSHRDRDYKKKSSTDSKSDRDKSRSSRDSSDKSKEKNKDSKDKIKDEKINSSGKDLKDMYKEKIRELREKKELTEKEKLNKDKDRSRDSKDKKDSKDSSSKESKDRRDSKEHRSSSSSSRSHRHESSSRSKRDDSKSNHDKKRDDRHSRDKSRSQGDSDAKRSSKDDKDKDSLSKSLQKRKESKSDESRKSSDKSCTEKEKDKDKKRREEKKSKSKDDHSSLHKSSNDRRSSDRDGSSGSNGKSSKNSCPGSSTSSKPNSSLKETGNTSNSSSETSDGVDESQMEECHNTDAAQEAIKVDQENGSAGVNAKRVDLGQSEISLPLKKRPLHTEDADNLIGEIKKPKIEKNSKETADNNDQVITVVPDNDRVQIIEVYEPQDDDDDENEPYPDDADINLKLEQSSGVIMEGESIFKINIGDNCKSNLSEMEMSIRESLNEMIVDKIMDTVSYENKKSDDTADEDTFEVDDCKIEEKKIICHSEDKDCLYFIQNDEESERLIRFRQFLKSQSISYYGEDENFINNDEDDNHDNDVDDTEEKIEQLVPNEENQESALANTMAPPQLKRKHSTSPLSDIVLNLDNNNDGHKDLDSVVGDLEKDEKSEKDKETGIGKKKLGRPKRQRPSVSSSSPNDDFIMPLSPESDVSAT